MFLTQANTRDSLQEHSALKELREPVCCPGPEDQVEDTEEWQSFAPSHTYLSPVVGKQAEGPCRSWGLCKLMSTYCCQSKGFISVSDSYLKRAYGTLRRQPQQDSLLSAQAPSCFCGLPPRREAFINDTVTLPVPGTEPGSCAW